jgi:hypothetical protein
VGGGGGSSSNGGSGSGVEGGMMMSVEVASRVSQIRDMLPHVGEGFVAACLDALDNDVERVLHHLLEVRVCVAPPAGGACVCCTTCWRCVCVLHHLLEVRVCVALLAGRGIETVL